MKNLLATLFVLNVLILVACGEDSTTERVVKGGSDCLTIVAEASDLPECTEENEGDRAFVKKDNASRICVDGEWKKFDDKNVLGDTVFTKSNPSCSTKDLEDKSGIKIICNGDSIGVVLNGSKGEKGAAGRNGENGKDGADGVDGAVCVAASLTDTTVKVSCGNQTVVIDLLKGIAMMDTAVQDSEVMAVSMDSLTGYSQKGPFVKGATVFLYELENGYTLKQTNGNFTSNITTNTGRYKFSARNLVSPYVMLLVDGNYRNEVTGEISENAIKLKAISNLRMHKTANVNLLTHLEFERVYYLVTKKKLTVLQAKRKAQKEILSEFLMDLDGEKDAEELDVFGNSENDAVLLALSILLQGNRSEGALQELLSAISGAIAEDGVWNDTAAKIELADWVSEMDNIGYLDSIAAHVKKWDLGQTVPDFKKFLRHYWYTVLELGNCTMQDKVLKNPNDRSSRKEVYFTCDDGLWRLSTNIEKDTAGWGTDFEEVEIRSGSVNKDLMYVFDKGVWREATQLETALNRGCSASNIGDAAQRSDGNWFVCREQGWVFPTYSIEVDTLSWGPGSFDGEIKLGNAFGYHYIYETSTGVWRPATDLERDTYDYENNSPWGAGEDGEIRTGALTGFDYIYDSTYWRSANSVETKLGGCSLAKENKVDVVIEYRKDAEGGWYKHPLFYICHSRTWSVATEEQYDLYDVDCLHDGSIFSGKMEESSNRYVCDDGEFRAPDRPYEELFGTACTKYNKGMEIQFRHSYYMCDGIYWRLSTKTIPMSDWWDGKSPEMEKFVNLASYLTSFSSWMTRNVVYLYNDVDTTTYRSYCRTDDCEYGRYWTLNAAKYACPSDMRIPAKEDFELLISLIGDLDYVGKALSSSTGWDDEPGLDLYNLSMFPAGYGTSDGAFEYVGKKAYFWTSTPYEQDTTEYYYFVVSTTSGETGFGHSSDIAASVRCLF